MADKYRIRRVVADADLRSGNWFPAGHDVSYLSPAPAISVARELNSERQSDKEDIFVVFKNDEPYWSPEEGELDISNMEE